ncbi:MAG: response regulator, partial [Sphingobacteriia bacterium]
MKTLNLLLVDDHKIIINGIRSMLEDVPGISILGEANNGREAVEKAMELPVDVVLMDIKMPQMNGIEATEEINVKKPDVKVIALTMFDDDEYITSMLQAGARGYILKNTGKQELISALERVSEGDTYFSREVTTAVMNQFMSKAGTMEAAPNKAKQMAAPPIELTTREVEILRHIAYEMTNQEIADKLFISPRTVHSHRRNLMQKIGVKNTAGLVRYAI